MKSSDIVIKIMEMDLVQAYNWLTTMEKAPANILKQARWGWLRPPIDIHDYIHGNITKKGKKGLMLYQGRAYKSRDFWTDIEKRQQVIKKWLVAEYDTDPIANPRMKIPKKEIIYEEPQKVQQ